MNHLSRVETLRRRAARGLVWMTLFAAPLGAAAQTVVSFTVINADTGAEISTHPSAATVSLASTPRINIRANASGVRSVVFTDGTSTRTENTAPYAYKGNNGPIYLPWSPAAGIYRINAHAHSGSNGSGTAGPVATLTLTLTGADTTPPVVGERPRSRNEAARFLAQATFGPVDSDIDRLMTIGYSAWIDEQFNATRSGTHESFVRAVAGNDKEVVASVWKQAFTERDQLRQRMAYALSQIFVISLADGDVDNHDAGVAAWMDGLHQRGFGKYRELLNYVSLSPMMGIYLSHLANQKADVASGRVPDENYAREVMQLFSIGLVKLQPNGQPVKNAAGELQETYTPTDVSELAKVFTGWSWACPNWPDKNCFLRGESNNRQDPDRAVKPMVAYPAFHSGEPKAFLGKSIAANLPPAETLRIALDHLAAHPNVAPFMSRLLIQRFTTSNPSPTYVGAVAQAFTSSGGDMKAVIKAVLMHPEARVVNDHSGKVREPVLRLSALVRAFPHTSRSGKFEIELTDNPSSALAQAPLHSPSVFNFYRPGYVAPGSESAARGLTAPELQILNETSAAGYVNFMRDSIGYGVGFAAGAALTRRDLIGNYSNELALAHDVPVLVERVTTRLTYGGMSDARKAEIRNAVSGIAWPRAGSSAAQIDAAKRSRVNAAILLTVSAPEFVVLK